MDADMDKDADTVEASRLDRPGQVRRSDIAARPDRQETADRA
ncbi:hypothetical protein ACFY04_20775 [Streptomyces sp. NPDC001549]